MHGCDVLNKRGFARPYVPSEHTLVIEDVHSFALEHHGSKFGVVHGDPPTRISMPSTARGMN